MYKLNKLYSFHISLKDKDAIKAIRENDINVSKFLRMSLRRLENVIKSQKKKVKKDKISNNKTTCCFRFKRRDDNEKAQNAKA
jgi:hypothetical protein